MSRSDFVLNELYWLLFAGAPIFSPAHLRTKPIELLKSGGNRGQSGLSDFGEYLSGMNRKKELPYAS